MSLRAQLNDAMKEAMKTKDAKRLATVRLVLAALKDKDIAARSETSRDLLGDDEILGLTPPSLTGDVEPSSLGTAPASADSTDDFGGDPGDAGHYRRSAYARSRRRPRRA